MKHSGSYMTEKKKKMAKRGEDPEKWNKGFKFSQDDMKKVKKREIKKLKRLLKKKKRRKNPQM